MICIYCNGELAVTNSRPQLSRNQTWRRRLCKACGAVFTSIESINLSQALIVRKDGQKSSNNTLVVAKTLNLQPFDRDQLFISIYNSLRHRPTAAKDARGITDTVIAQLVKTAEHSYLDTRIIIRAVINILNRFDKAAATYYAAFHKI